jgi:hypothetical protein
MKVKTSTTPCPFFLHLSTPALFCNESPPIHDPVFEQHLLSFWEPCYGFQTSAIVSSPSTTLSSCLVKKSAASCILQKDQANERLDKTGGLSKHMRSTLLCLGGLPDGLLLSNPFNCRRGMMRKELPWLYSCRKLLTRAIGSCPSCQVRGLHPHFVGSACGHGILLKRQLTNLAEQLSTEGVRSTFGRESAPFTILTNHKGF